MRGCLTCHEPLRFRREINEDEFIGRVQIVFVEIVHDPNRGVPL